MPSRATIMAKIKCRYKYERAKLQMKLDNPTNVAITTDSYTQKYTHKNYNTISVQFRTETGSLVTATLNLTVLDSVSHNAESIKTFLAKKLKDYKIKGKILFFLNLKK